MYIICSQNQVVKMRLFQTLLGKLQTTIKEDIPFLLLRRNERGLGLYRNRPWHSGYTRYHILEFSMYPMSRRLELGSTYRQNVDVPALVIRHNNRKNSSTHKRSTKVSGNMDKQSGCLPLKVDTQWRCFYYSMNTLLFLVSISSVIVQQLLVGV